MFTLNCRGRLVQLNRPLVMGIINATPDSFYTGSRHQETEAILGQARQMLEEGADILDIGGQSTRPGSVQVGAQEELERVLPGMEAIHNSFPDALISIDTFYGAVATAAVQAGASIVNDISAGSMDEELIPSVAKLKVPYVLMHMKGKPSTMQQEANYEDITREVLDFFIRQTGRMREAGIRDIILDPGFGFGKTSQHNFQLLHQLSVFSMLELPLMAGLSRKSTIWKTLNISPEEALNGTTVLHTIALLNGAAILRVHDVKAAVEAVKLVEAYRHHSS